MEQGIIDFRSRTVIVLWNLFETMESSFMPESRMHWIQSQLMILSDLSFINQRQLNHTIFSFSVICNFYIVLISCVDM
jgi:hypothetical protein